MTRKARPARTRKVRTKGPDSPLDPRRTGSAQGTTPPDGAPAGPGDPCEAPLQEAPPGDYLYGRYRPETLEEAQLLLGLQLRELDRLRKRASEAELSGDQWRMRYNSIRSQASKPLQARTVQRLVTYHGEPAVVERLLCTSLNAAQQYQLQGVQVTIEQVSDTRRNITPDQDAVPPPSSFGSGSVAGLGLGSAVSDRISGVASNIRERERG